MKIFGNFPLISLHFHNSIAFSWRWLCSEHKRKYDLICYVPANCYCSCEIAFQRVKRFSVWISCLLNFQLNQKWDLLKWRWWDRKRETDEKREDRLMFVCFIVWCSWKYSAFTSIYFCSSISIPTMLLMSLLLLLLWNKNKKNRLLCWKCNKTACCRLLVVVSIHWNSAHSILPVHSIRIKAHVFLLFPFTMATLPSIFVNNGKVPRFLFQYFSNSFSLLYFLVVVVVVMWMRMKQDVRCPRAVGHLLSLSLSTLLMSLLLLFFQTFFFLHACVTDLHIPHNQNAQEFLHRNPSTTRSNERESFRQEQGKKIIVDFRLTNDVQHVRIEKSS